MLNTEKLNQVLAEYRKSFNLPKPKETTKTWWEFEQYKWIAVQHFQKHWDIDADDFGAMFEEATAKCGNLLTVKNYFPKGVMLDFIDADKEAVREMFRNLFDEDLPVGDRVNNFIAESERLRSTYGATKWKSHYQTLNSISTYLWLRYPDKYYIYKYSECKVVAETLESDFKMKKGAKADVLVDFNKFYDELAAYIANDKPTTDMVHAALTPECYPDPMYRTLTIDVSFYISRYYSEEPGKYWPSEDEYSPNLTKEQWKEYIEKIEFPDHKGCMGMLKGLMELGGEASCKKLSTVYGGLPQRYIGSAVNIGKRVKKYFGLPPCMDGDDECYFAIPFLGRYVNEEGKEYYSYKIREELLAALKEIDLSSIDPYKHDDDEGKGYWWLNANPKIWSFADIAVGGKQTYTLYNDNGHKRRIFQNFIDAKEGDMVIGYESTPIKQVVAIAKIAKEQDGTNIEFEKLEGLVSPIDYQTLKDCPELKDMEYFNSPQGSLFRLTKDEFDFIMDIIRDENPLKHTSLSNTKFTKAKFLDEIFMDEVQYDELEALLKKKKNIILQGAPGVGKTFVARKLAYAIMGEEDDSRIEFVQFHQNYSYEDFIMGYRPEGSGFRLEEGVFYRFCQNASNHPDKEYFFIIDEINRGNMSRIFGELMMLIEEGYRGEKIALPYCGRTITVPKNLYILGCMNTADRSLAMIDYALRRRFSFFELEPAFGKQSFKKYLEQRIHSSEVTEKIINRFSALNEKIADEEKSGLGKGFCIGHSYFCVAPADGQSAEDWYNLIIKYEIVPLLDEYWWDDKKIADEYKKELLKD